MIATTRCKGGIAEIVQSESAAQESERQEGGAHDAET